MTRRNLLLLNKQTIKKGHTIFDFNKQLKDGLRGEELFLSSHKGLVTKTDGRKGDFIHIPTGEKIELKSDYYDMKKTKNFFFERFSDVSKQSPGGPWQADSHDAKIFIYFFVNNACMFKFRTSDLIKALNDIIPHLGYKDVPNRGWTTRGYAVPRDCVIDLATEIRLTKGVRNGHAET